MREQGRMNYVAITVEYVLAGLLVLLIFGVPFVSDTTALPDADGSWFVIAGLAYMLGTIADRVAESALAPAEAYLKLRQTKLLDFNASIPQADPLPLQHTVVAVRAGGGGILEWHNQLRSRLRLARNLFVYGHWVLIALWVHSIPLANRNPYWLLIFVSLALAFHVTTSICIEIPKTDDFVEQGCSAKQEVIDTLRAAVVRNKNKYILAVSFAGPVVTFGSLALQPWDNWLRGLGYWSIGLVLWFGAGFSWTRLNQTFIQFMQSVEAQPNSG
jgi:hypothetical protein